MAALISFCSDSHLALQGPVLAPELGGLLAEAALHLRDFVLDGLEQMEAAVPHLRAERETRHEVFDSSASRAALNGGVRVGLGQERVLRRDRDVHHQRASQGDERIDIGSDRRAMQASLKENCSTRGRLAHYADSVQQQFERKLIGVQKICLSYYEATGRPKWWGASHSN